MDSETEPLLNRFLEEPGGHIVLDSDLRVVSVELEYLRLTLSRREDIIGKVYMNTVTEPERERHESAVDMIQRTCASAFKTHQTQKYGERRMDVRSAEDGHIEERWWRGAFIPVTQGGDVYIIHRLENVTHEKVTERKLNAQRRSNYVLYGLVVLVLGLGLFLYGRQTHNNSKLLKETARLAHNNSELSKNTCHQVQTINARIYQTIKTQTEEISKPGSEIYKFYKQNPELVAAAEASATQEEKIFRPKSC